MRYEIRDAVRNDLPTINSIARAHSGHGWEIDGAKWLSWDDAERILVAVRNGQVAGWLYANLRGTGRIIIERMIVANESRLHGVGSALLDGLAQRYPDRCLVAGAEPEVQPFYARNGFLPAQDRFEPMIRPPAGTHTCCSVRTCPV